MAIVEVLKGATEDHGVPACSSLGAKTDQEQAARFVLRHMEELSNRASRRHRQEVGSSAVLTPDRDSKLLEVGPSPA